MSSNARASAMKYEDDLIAALVMHFLNQKGVMVQLRWFSAERAAEARDEILYQGSTANFRVRWLLYHLKILLDLKVMRTW